MQRRFDYGGHAHARQRQGAYGAFWLTESDADLIWLCIGDYRGPLSVSAFVRYARARYVHHNRELTYRIYLTDALKVVANLEVRYADYVLPQKKAEEPEQIIDRISDKLKKAEEDDESI